MEKDDSFCLERYDILHKVGEGSYGCVFKAIDKKTREVVALKKISLEEDDENAFNDVNKEIRILRACAHPNVVSYKGGFFSNPDLYIAMEFCGGGSCSEVLELLQSPMAEGQISYIMREALKGLEALHAHKMIHRDIKGGNILLTEDGSVKLADFGVSASLQNTVSKAQTFIGTPYWMAPEVVSGEKYNTKADVWSMGITAIELADMEPPLASKHPMRVLFMIPRNPPPTVADKSKWSPLFLQFLEACLVKDPEHRPTAQQLLSHPFLKTKPSKASLLEILEAAAEARANRPPSDAEDSDESDGEGYNMGTCIVNGTNNMGTCVINDDYGTVRSSKSPTVQVTSFFETLTIGAGEDGGTIRRVKSNKKKRTFPRKNTSTGTSTSTMLQHSLRPGQDEEEYDEDFSTMKKYDTNEIKERRQQKDTMTKSPWAKV